MPQSLDINISLRNRIIATVILSLLAVTGNYLNLPLFFGVSFIFGSMAVILAVGLLGTTSAVIVAAIGGAYTLILFGHPYALIIFVLEAFVVGVLYRRGLCNLVLADLLYWCTLGIPMVLMLYQNAIGMDWNPALLIALKQSLNGVFNTLIASVVLLFVNHFLFKTLQASSTKIGIKIQSILFNTLLSVILLAGIPPIIQQSDLLQAEREEALANSMIDKAKGILQSIQNTQIVNKEALQTLLDDEYFSENIGVAIIDSQQQVLAYRGEILRSIKDCSFRTISDKISIWLPDGNVPTMLRWKNGRYHVRIPLEQNTLAEFIVLEYPAAALVKSLEESTLSLFMFVAGLILIGILISLGVSYLFARPIRQLDNASKNIADQINSGMAPVIPDSSIQEFKSLADTLRSMSTRLVENFDELHRVQNSLETQVKQRTIELEHVNTALKDREFALDQHAIVSIADVAGNIVYANKKFCEISGYGQDEILGNNHRLLKSEYHPENFYEELWSKISQGETWQGEICNRKKDGELYWVQSTITPFLDSAGIPYQYIAIRTDITHVKASEIALRESETRMGLAIEGTGDGIWDWNMPKEIMTFSRQYETMMGYAEHELPSVVNSWVQSVHADDLPRVQKVLQEYLAGQLADYLVELRLRCKDGSYKWIMCRGKLVESDQDGKPLRMIGIHTDITERKKSELALIISREEADRANQAKSQFLSSMSHELRTPMNAILGFGQLLDMDDLLNAEQHENIKEILNAGNHLLVLINEVLDLSKIESGSIDMSIEPVDLCEVLEECFSLIKPLVDKRNIKISHTGIKGVVVRADYIRLKQAFLNLLSNAIKYNREGGQVVVDVESAADNQARILVKDTGQGIAKEHLNDLFEPFNRLGAEGGTIEGTGIGLTITRRIIEIMGGSIDVESEQGVGSCFWIELPMEVRSEGALQKTEKDYVHADNALIEQQYTILYIEDNPANLKLVSKLLARRQHIHLLTAHTPELGLELADAHQPQLILLDINMPTMSGYEVLARLKADEKLRSTPVLAVSAEAMPNDIDRGMKAGFSHYLTKPINVEEFNAVLDSYLLKDS